MTRMSTAAGPIHLTRFQTQQLQQQAPPPVPRLVLRRIPPDLVSQAKSALAYRRETGKVLRYYDPATAKPPSPSPLQSPDLTDDDEEEEEAVDEPVAQAAPVPDKSEKRKKDTCGRKKKKKHKARNKDPPRPESGQGSHGHQNHDPHNEEQLSEDAAAASAEQQEQSVPAAGRKQKRHRLANDPEAAGNALQVHAAVEAVSLVVETANESS